MISIINIPRSTVHQETYLYTINDYIHITFLKSMASGAINWVIYLFLFGTKNKFHGIIVNSGYILYQMPLISMIILQILCVVSMQIIKI